MAFPLFISLTAHDAGNRADSPPFTLILDGTYYYKTGKNEYIFRSAAFMCSSNSLLRIMCDSLSYTFHLTLESSRPRSSSSVDILN